MSQQLLKIGLIGLDTSHVMAFTELLNSADHPYHVPGGWVVAAFPGGSPDFELSASRVQGYTDKLSADYGICIMDSIEEVAEASDVLMLESVDGRIHLEQFSKLAPFRKPVFIDKPFAVNSRDAKSISALAKHHGIPIMSCSALRYAEGLTTKLRGGGDSPIIGMDCYGPMALQSTQPGLFWYGIHMVDMLYSGMGKGCLQVSSVHNGDHDFVTGLWKDGRAGTIRGNRRGNTQFGAVIHRENSSEAVDVYAHQKPYYASLLEQIMEMFRSKLSPIDVEETLEIIRFIEAANESRATGRTVFL
ncbi:gfo/Idh/MocA family oxidoreductase [Paenibacillus glucanolyticus]|uniref:gfo/Idh/MocA family oxidoreductase n=1 Tax=Paenibacillus glucanolyticus TaxID=59843 RepID=UPI0030C98401